MAHCVRLMTTLNEKGLVHVTFDAVVLTAHGIGTLGVHARVAACRTKPERCVLHETQAVEERRVQVEEGKRDAVILECKLHLFLLY